MLIPPPHRFRVLLCRAGDRFCGRSWTANSRDDLDQHLEHREQHEQLCRTGFFAQAEAAVR